MFFAKDMRYCAVSMNQSHHNDVEFQGGKRQFTLHALMDRRAECATDDLGYINNKRTVTGMALQRGLHVTVGITDVGLYKDGITSGT